MVIDGKAGKWVVNSNAKFLINNQAISCLGPTDTSKYLGLQVEAHTSNKSTIVNLQNLIDKISGSPLKPQQRLWALRNNILPKIQHPLVLSPAAIGLLKTLDVMVRGAVRSWLHLPKDVPCAFFHAGLKDGGLGIPSLVNRIPRLQSARLSALHSSEDPVVVDAMRSEFVKRWEERLTCQLIHGNSKETEDRLQAEALITSRDGIGMTGYRTEAAAVSASWITDGTMLMPGHRYIDGIKMRMGCAVTEERKIRGRGQRPRCSMGCGGADGLGHMLQTCPKLHGLRVERHNKVLDLLESSLASIRGTVTYREPRIPTSIGLRIPDLIMVQPDTIAILDAQVVADAALKPLSEIHYSKLLKYNTPDVLNFAARLGGDTEVRRGRVKVCPISLSWRGVLHRESAEMLTTLGLSNHQTKLLVVRSIEGSIKIWRTQHRTGGRPLGVH